MFSKPLQNEGVKITEKIEKVAYEKSFNWKTEGNEISNCVSLVHNAEYEKHPYIVGVRIENHYGKEMDFIFYHENKKTAEQEYKTFVKLYKTYKNLPSLTEHIKSHACELADEYDAELDDSEYVTSFTLL